MLEKLLDILKIILEKYLIPALISIFLTILSVNFFTNNLSFLKKLSQTENYILQGLFYFFVVLIVYYICHKVKQKIEQKQWLIYNENENIDDLINEIDSYSTQERKIIKDLFNSNNTPITITSDAYDAKHFQDKLYDKVILSLTDEYNNGHVYICRLTDNFYKELKILQKRKGCISHY